MLTIFTIPKPFLGHIGLIQRNAIGSWLQLRPRCQVILLGDELGTAETAQQLGLVHMPQIERNSFGTPLVFDAFTRAQSMASNKLMCYVNSDIILPSEFTNSMRFVRKSRFLLSGQRWNVSLHDPVDYSDPAWEARLRQAVVRDGQLDTCAAMDYFVFPRGLCRNMPPFVVGRGGWDGWFVYWARLNRIPFIDGTAAVTAVHQSHDYSHLSAGKSGAYWTGEEARVNLQLAGTSDRFFHLRDATWLLAGNGLKLALTADHLNRRRATVVILEPRANARTEAYKKLLALAVVLAPWLPRLHPRRAIRGLRRRMAAGSRAVGS